MFAGCSRVVLSLLEMYVPCSARERARFSSMSEPSWGQCRVWSSKNLITNVFSEAQQRGFWLLHHDPEQKFDTKQADALWAVP